MTANSSTQAGALQSSHLLLLMTVRFVFNVAFRVLYPLLPFLAQRFVVSDTTVNLLVTVQFASGLLSLIGGIVADRFGGRATMALGLVGFNLGAGLCALSTSFNTFLLGYTLIGLGTCTYVPALQSYVGRHVPFSRRGRALGTIELAWALAGIIGVPLLTGIVASRNSTAFAFLLVLIGGILALVGTLLLLPPDQRSPETHSASVGVTTLLRRPQVAGAVGFLVLLLVAQEMIFIVQSSWQAQFFGLDTASRGRVFGLIGAAELVASLSVALLADRLGVRRTLIAVTTLTMLCYLLLPATLGSLGLYSIVLVMLMFGFEFAIVVAFILMSELAPDARGTTVALGATAITGGRTTGSLIGLPLWAALGSWELGLIACISTASALTLLVRYVHLPKSSS